MEQTETNFGVSPVVGAILIVALVLIAIAIGAAFLVDFVPDFAKSALAFIGAVVVVNHGISFASSFTGEQEDVEGTYHVTTSTDLQVFTPERVELLRHAYDAEGSISVADLASAVDRDLESVERDVQALSSNNIAEYDESTDTVAFSYPRIEFDATLNVEQPLSSA